MVVDRRHAVLAVVVALLLPLCSAHAAYPEKPVTLVVPYPSGGRTDLTARIVAQFLKEPFGQPVVVSNHAGGGGVIGAKKVAAATPDGYTLGFFSWGVVIAQYTFPVPSDLKEYEPIALINVDPAVLAVNSASPYKDLQAFIDEAKSSPGKLAMGTSPGAGAQIFNLGFSKVAGGLKFRDVPYAGGGQRAAALAGKHIDADMDVPAVYKSLVDAGKIRILGVASVSRSPLYKDWPTFQEQGIAYVGGSWHGVFAPRGTAEKILTVVDAALETLSRDAKFVEAMHKAFIEVRYLNRSRFIDFLGQEDIKIREITKDLGVLEPRK